MLYVLLIVINNVNQVMKLARKQVLNSHNINQLIKIVNHIKMVKMQKNGNLINLSLMYFINAKKDLILRLRIVNNISN